ncbi:MAG: hypothetical protein ACE5KU_00275 [Nitrososphaerales archaeon]
MQSEKYPLRCPVWDCKDGHPRFETEEALKTHLKLVHPRNVKKNGLNTLLMKAKSWAKERWS